MKKKGGTEPKKKPRAKTEPKKKPRAKTPANPAWVTANEEAWKKRTFAAKSTTGLKHLKSQLEHRKKPEINGAKDRYLIINKKIKHIKAELDRRSTPPRKKSMRLEKK